MSETEGGERGISQESCPTDTAAYRSEPGPV